MDELRDDQVMAVARGFMQVWNRFEATLGEDLARIERTLHGASQSGNFNFALFYRACSGIYPQGSISMGEFGNALAVPLSTATRIADWLVERGYILRLPDDEDRRVVKVALTDKGRELYEAIDKYIYQRVLQVLSGISEEERVTLLSLAGKLVRN